MQRFLTMMKTFITLLLALILCTACEYRFSSDDAGSDVVVCIERYDRIESRYLTTGDFAALQQMSTEYPVETRMLIEDILNIGDVKDHEINTRLLQFFQDSLLQVMISDVEQEYANMDDLNNQLAESFDRLTKLLPGIEKPRFYAQITALDQSIVVGNQTVAISLDKYMGKDYPLYAKFYKEDQRASMSRSSIVPDCLSFYILSLYRLPNFATATQQERDMHMGRIQWVTNKALGQKFYNTEFVNAVEIYMMQHPDTSCTQLLSQQ